MSKFRTTSGAYLSVERTQTKVTVTIDHGRVHATTARWLVQCSREDEDAVPQAMFDTDESVYVTAEEFLKLPSDPREDGSVNDAPREPRTRGGPGPTTDAGDGPR
jgi:hypothetical protein